MDKVKEWLVRKDWLVPNWVWVVVGVVVLGVVL
jgi:hypothetical protein